MKFNIQRFTALLKREFLINFVPAIKLSAVIVLILFAILSIAVITEGRDNDFTVLINFGLFLFIGGLIYASFSFYEFRKVSSRAEYLALPGSHIEKLLSKWFFTNPIYILSISLLFLVMQYLLSPLWAHWGDQITNQLFVTKPFWNIVGVFFIIHSIFMLGSIAFNKGALLKTFLVLLAVGAICIVLNAGVFRIVWSEYFESLFEFKKMDGAFRFGKNYRSPDEMPQIQFLIFVFKYLLAPVIWVASYFKLTEKEV